MFRRIIREIEAVKERDPAARSTGEVLLGYPGIHALFSPDRILFKPAPGPD
jgi:serine O-acetyltransferase